MDNAKQSPDRGLHIRFMDGTSMKITFPTQTEDLYRRKVMIEEMMKRGMIMVEAEGGVHFIPLANIKYMSVYPSGDQADPGIIKGASFSE